MSAGTGTVVGTSTGIVQPCRVFISYRSSDGRDKATALARDLGQRFGDDAVFLDKDDLRGGSAWRDEVARTLGHRPALLLLVTPGLLGDVDAAGRRRIDQADDPVRRELQAALDGGAELIPVLCDGIEAPPAAGTLPPPFDRLADFTWRRLRAYDWAADVQRLTDDLLALGVPPRAAAPAASKVATPPPRRGLLLGGAAALVTLLAGGGWYAAQRRAADPSADLSGDWQATLAHGEQAVLTLHEAGGLLTLASTPIEVSARPEWAENRRFWLERTGMELGAVMYRGEGRVIRDPGTAARIDIALQVLPGGGDALLDSGNLSATASADGHQLAGRIWLNGAQADWPAAMQRR